MGLAPLARFPWLVRRHSNLSKPNKCVKSINRLCPKRSTHSRPGCSAKSGCPKCNVSWKYNTHAQHADVFDDEIVEERCTRYCARTRPEASRETSEVKDGSFHCNPPQCSKKDLHSATTITHALFLFRTDTS